MPAPTLLRAQHRYTQDSLRRALDAVKIDGASISAASRRFNIPKTTLHEKLRSRYNEAVSVGRPSVLTKEEEDLVVQWVLNIAKAGFPSIKNHLIDSASCLIRDLNRPNPFKNNVPGESWYNLFLGRHPIISQSVSKAWTSSRMKVTEERLREWTLNLKTYLQEKGLSNIFNDPQRVFSADESAFYLCPEGNKVIARKGDKRVYQQDESENEYVTVIVNANAAGKLAPPMVVFDYELIPASILRTIPDEWGLGKSETGWVTKETFYEYVANVFHPWLKSSNITFPVLLFIDGHSPHFSKYLSDFCSANGIEIVGLYPNSKHLMQPLDMAVFSPLKEEWKRSVDQWRLTNNGKPLKKEKVFLILQNVLQKLDTKVIISGFKVAGLDKSNFGGTNYSPIMKKQIHSSRIYSPEKKLSELRSHLHFLETKIGLENVRQFAINEVPTRDKSLYDIWKNIKEEVTTLKEEEIACKKLHPIPTVEPENVSQINYTTLETTDITDDPDEDLAIPLAEGGEHREKESREKEVGQVLAERNESLKENGLNPNIGMFIEIVEPNDEDVFTPNNSIICDATYSEQENTHQSPGAATSSATISHMATSLKIPHPASKSSPPSKIQSSTLQQSPGPSSANTATVTHSSTPQEPTGRPVLTISHTPFETIFSITKPRKTSPSVLKRCLPYPSKTSIKKKVKSTKPTPGAVASKNYNLSVKRKGEKKKQEL